MRKLFLIALALFGFARLCAFASLRETTILHRTFSRKDAEPQRKTQSKTLLRNSAEDSTQIMSATMQKEPDATPELDQLCINTIRALAIDAVKKAESGHPGLPLSAAPMAYVLWTRFMRYNPKNPKWENRDRFLLSAGHGCMLLYSLLYLTGYDLSLDEIKNFRQWGSKTPGHPEYGLAPGVEITTGPLGQGFANGVGMAMAEAHLAAQFNQPDFSLIDHYVYAIVSDGHVME